MSKISKFIGRTNELKNLNKFTKKSTSSLLVIKGRRRIGKSRLIEEFATQNKIKLLSFEGLAPEKGITAQHQKNEFAKQMGFNSLITNDWSDLFKTLAGEIQNDKIIVLMDEISWMAHGDITFLPKLKNAWDLLLKKTDNLILILCGSASSWIEKNLLNSTGFVGRISFILTLEELKINEISSFWGKNFKNISSHEILKILSITGGVPKYLEEIDPNLTAEDNIRDLCFKKGGLLFEEFNNIFGTSFIRKSNVYEKIVRSLAEGTKEAAILSKILQMKSSGRISEYLNELELAGFVKRDYTWKITSSQDAKLSKYRLSDNYLRFYLKYIDKYKTKIERNSFQAKSLCSLPAWDSMMALQFENLVLNNRKLLLEILGIEPENVVSENPYFQHSTTKQKGCQIDYMIQTKHRCLYICEIKFSKNTIGVEIINEVQQKIDTLKGIRGFSYRPILIHASNVHKDVIARDYFIKIIDFSSLLDC
ncbi:MAG: ATP-binding protein [Gammaproteobacteria bacterium]